MLNQDARLWLVEERSLSGEVCDRLGLFSASATPGNDFVRDLEGDWIGFPCYRGDKLLNVKYRNINDKKFLNHKNGEQIFFNENALFDPDLIGEPIIITEGFEDAIACMSAGFRRVVSVPNGGSQLADAAARAWGFLDFPWPKIREASEIILAVDDDRVGFHLRQALLYRLGHARCRLLAYPSGCKDANEFLVREGAPALRQAIEKAEFAPVSGIYTESTVPIDPPVEYIRPGGADFPMDLKASLAIGSGQVSIWTGRANHGKSSFLRDVMFRLMRYDNVICGVAALEDPVTRGAYRRAAAQWLGRVPVEDLTEHHMDAATEFLDGRMYYFVPDWEEDATVDWWLTRAEVAVRRHRAWFLAIDPWTEIETGQDGKVPETYVVKAALKRIRTFAERFGVHVAVVVHPAKLRSAREDYIPTGDDCADSAQWANKSHLGLSIQRNGPDTPQSTVKVWKVKDQDIMGPLGEFSIVRNKSGRFTAY